MAEATDRTTTPSRISWDDALTRLGSFEALLSWLRQVPVLAWHQGLYCWPSGKKRSEPGEFDPDWWAQARVDLPTGRVVFPRPQKYQIFFVGFVEDPAPQAVVPRITEEVFAFGIELERGVVEVRFPLRPEPERVEAPTKPAARKEPERVEAPTKPAARKVPERWLDWARKEYPQQQGERPGDYICRLHGLMQKADNVTEVWEYKNFRRRYYEAVKAYP